MPRQRHIEPDIDFDLENLVKDKDLCELYRHFTYIVSIFGSAAIYYLSFFVESCNDEYQSYIKTIIFVKCFCIYDSTPMEIIHHIVQLGLTYLGDSMKICDNNGVIVVKAIDGILVTPIFQNIKYYFKIPKESMAYNMLDVVAGLFFFYYRLQFNYVVWSGILSNSLDFVIEENNFIYKNTTKKLFELGMYIITFMNVYWMYLLIKKMNKKYNKTLKEE